MNARTPGHSGLSVSAIGLGCKAMSHAYGRPDDVESAARMRSSGRARSADGSSRYTVQQNR